MLGWLKKNQGRKGARDGRRRTYCLSSIRNNVTDGGVLLEVLSDGQIPLNKNKRRCLSRTCCKEFLIKIVKYKF